MVPFVVNICTMGIGYWVFGIGYLVLGIQYIKFFNFYLIDNNFNIKILNIIIF
jgi:hypothetical protein